MEYIDIRQLIGLEKPSFSLEEAESKSLNSENTVEAYRTALQLKNTALAALATANKEMESFLNVFFRNFHNSLHLDKNEAIATLMDEESPIREVLLALYPAGKEASKQAAEVFRLLDGATTSEKNLKEALRAIESNWKMTYNTGPNNSALQVLENTILDAVVIMDEETEVFFDSDLEKYRSVMSSVKSALHYTIAQLKLCLNIKVFFGVMLAAIPETRWEALPMLMLTKDVYVGLPAIRPDRHKSLILKDVLPISDEFSDADIGRRELLPGAYILLGGPMSGKSLLVNSIFHHLQKLEGVSTCLLHCMEPSTTENRSLLTWSEISLGLSALIYSDRNVIAVDSLRFLNAASPYPAKRGGINSGLEIYATQLNELCVRANKVGFFVISTSDMSRQVTDTYQALLVGSTQGIFVPGRITPDSFGKSIAPVEISLRNGDRSYQYITYDCIEPLRSLQVAEETEDEEAKLGMSEADKIYNELLGV